jgi:hypothetical protein
VIVESMMCVAVLLPLLCTPIFAVPVTVDPRSMPLPFGESVAMPLVGGDGAPHIRVN